MNDTLRYTSASIMAIVSTIGIAVNTYVLHALLTRKTNLSIFYKLCISKTICNIITCAAFFAWSAPCTFLNYYYMPHWVNIFWGQTAGWGAYVTGVCIQVCLSLNRFTVTYFPLSSNGKNVFLNIRYCLFGFTVIFVFSTVYGFPDGCGYVYSINVLSWNPVDSKCAVDHANQIFYFIFTISFISNSSNLATFMYLTRERAITANQAERVKRSRLMFAQSVTQDCLHVIDMLACQVIYKFNDALWFQFFCMSFVWLTIHVLDGIVMLIYNREIHPKWWRRRRGKKLASTAIIISTTQKW